MSVRAALNRLGFWNRLALVAAILTILILPAWGVANTNATASDIAGVGYGICTNEVDQRPNADVIAEDAKCMKEFEKTFDSLKAGWGGYGVGMLATFALCIVAYGLLWLMGAVAKWVWRGKRRKNTVAE